jgi:hypothetical protein
MNRRGFLRAALGASVGVVAGAELVEALSTRSIFLPPRGGWFSGRVYYKGAEVVYSVGGPSFLTNYVDPQLIGYLVRPMTAAGLMKVGDMVTGPGIPPGTRIIESFRITEARWRA